MWAFFSVLFFLLCLLGTHFNPELLLQLIKEVLASIAFLVGELGDDKDREGTQDKARDNRVQA